MLFGEWCLAFPLRHILCTHPIRGSRITSVPSYLNKCRTQIIKRHYAESVGKTYLWYHVSICQHAAVHYIWFPLPSARRVHTTLKGLDWRSVDRQWTEITPSFTLFFVLGLISYSKTQQKSPKIHLTVGERWGRPWTGGQSIAEQCNGIPSERNTHLYSLL